MDFRTHGVKGIGSWAGIVFVFSVSAGWAQVTARFINVGQAASALIEFKSGAILIDAGGENTGDNVYRNHLLSYLNDFFKSRPDLDRTLSGIIITHPHKDHTMYLMDVMKNFSVLTLVDNGGNSGSGVGNLKKARKFARDKKLEYVAVGDPSIRKRGRRLPLIESEGPGAPEITLLSGFRGCDNPNNDSIAVRIKTEEAVLLFTGDAENEDRKCEPELSKLATKFGNTSLLAAQVYHVAHHGSFNGTTPEFMKLVSPQISIISAGDPNRKKPGTFHAWQFGHPREVAVNTITEFTSGSRSDLGRVSGDSVVFSAAKQPETVPISKAVYCTCWQGDLKIEYRIGQTTPNVSSTGFRPPFGHLKSIT
jgi:beta-lactamase superfamily II metal-dependent hydrolase